MLRSKSRSQLGAGGAVATSPSPQPAYASSSSAAGSPNAANTVVKNILKSVESHVRVMSHLENISISSSFTALRLRKPKSKRGALGNDGGGNEEEWSSPFLVSRVHKGVAVPRNQGGHPPSESAHSTSTFAFYSDVIAPCLSNCCAGQSYLFLFTGPQESGRSQTLYGCPSKQSKDATQSASQQPRLYLEANEDGNERGVVELAAIDFLERVMQGQRWRADLEERAEGATQGSDKENRGVTSAGGVGDSGGGGGLVVTFSAFTTRGDQIIDTTTGRAVKMEAFPPPLGTVALPHMHLLDEQSIESFSFSSSGKTHHHHHHHSSGSGSKKDDEVASLGSGGVQLLPEKKYIDTSCIIQFHVYACVDGGGGGLNHGANVTPGVGLGKRTMATFTFVDMAAFRAPLCKEVTNVVDVVRKVAGLADDHSDTPLALDRHANHHVENKKTDNGGGGPEDFFQSTKLTQLLESALTGYVTLVSISTISGREDLYDGACAALSFAQCIKRIHQVFFLLHIAAPRWLFETGCALENLREERQKAMKGSYARGVYDYYLTASAWLTSHVGDVEGQLESLLAETETIRKGIECEVQAQEQSLQGSIDKEEGSAKKASEEARKALQLNNTQFETVKRLDEEIAQVEQRISHNDLKTSQRIGEMRAEIGALEAKKSSREKEVGQLSRERTLFDSKCEEVVSVLRKYAEDLTFSQVSYSSQHELQSLSRKRARLEEDLQMASVMVDRATDSLRIDRERRSLVSRLTMVQQRVESLRNTVRSSLSGGGLSDALVGFLGENGTNTRGDSPDDGHGRNRGTSEGAAKRANTRTNTHS